MPDESDGGGKRTDADQREDKATKQKGEDGQEQASVYGTEVRRRTSERAR